MNHSVAMRAADALALPEISPALASLIGRVEAEPENFRLQGIIITQQLKAEAQNALDAFEAMQDHDAYKAMIAPPSEARVRKWLAPLLIAVFNPPADAAFERNVRSITAALFDVPCYVLTAESATRASRTFDAWPSTKAVYDFLAAEVGPQARHRWAIRRVADAKVTPAASPSVNSTRTAEEVEYAASRVRMAIAAMRGGRPDDAPEPTPTPKFNGLSGERLAAHRARDPFVQAALAIKRRSA